MKTPKEKRELTPAEKLAKAGFTVTSVYEPDLEAQKKALRFLLTRAVSTAEGGRTKKP